MEIAIFILEYAIGLVRAVEPHNHEDSLQAGFAMESGLKSNALVLVMLADAGQRLGRWAQLDFLPIPILIDFYFGNID
jgi:hypothetical protein